MVNVSLTIPPVEFGSGATLTCSWTNLTNVMKVDYKRSSTNEVVYTYDTASNTKVGSGILSGTHGWRDMDAFVVYINVTIHNQFVMYDCHVTNDEGSYQSPSSMLDIAGKYQLTSNVSTCRIDAAILQHTICSIHLMSGFGFKSNQ